MLVQTLIAFWSLPINVAVANSSHLEMTPLTWDDAYAKAKQTLSQMSRDEKNDMMHSTMNQAGGWFVGNIKPVPRLGVPSLNMQDNGNGFRTTEDYMIGTVTCWPSSLAMAATWDEQLVHTASVAMGHEFATKGANVILGPGIFLVRVAKGGRNFETLAGEDPYLGSKLGAQWIAGMQSQGVIATLKHYIFNNQETHRGSFNAVVDDKTAWELYYPPFQAGVKAGAGAAMCSYNLQDGKHSCSNPYRLYHDLKGTMGFKGFVMSDWGAEHGTSIADGEDMDMVNGRGGDQFNPSSVSDADADRAVTRTLAAIYKMHLENTTKCVGGSCSDYLHADAQQGHHDLARQGATESIVLLKNEGDLLPLKSSTVKKIRVIGKAATSGVVNPNHGFDWTLADLYSGGGSGHVVPGYHVTPLDGIKQRASKAGIKVLSDSSNEQADVIIVVAGTTSSESRDRQNLDLDDNADNLIVAAANPKGTCAAYCSEVHSDGSILCDWTAKYSCPWDKYDGSKGRANDDGSIGYNCCCGDRTSEDQPCGGGGFEHSLLGPANVSKATSSSSAHSLDTKAKATVASTFSSTLSSTLAGLAGPTISNASTSCSGYCPSTGCGWTEEYSCPWAPKPGSKGRAGTDDIGYYCCCVARTAEDQPCGGPAPRPTPPHPSNPTNKVIVLLEVPGAILTPWRDDVQAIATLFLGGQETGNAWASVLFGDHAPTGRLPISMPSSEADTIEPSSSGTITYSEGLATGYRNKQFNHAFPFGHGLTYTNFSYSNAKSKACSQSVCVQFSLKNVGLVAAATVPQLYLEFPVKAKQPASILKGFTKTEVIEPGATLSVTFELTKSDISYWDTGKWKQVSSATAHIGASSEDLRLSIPLSLASSSGEVVVV